eukprot:103042-Chlamydomonas_euryale.AAC.8
MARRDGGAARLWLLSGTRLAPRPCGLGPDWNRMAWKRVCACLSPPGRRTGASAGMTSGGRLGIGKHYVGAQPDASAMACQRSSCYCAAAVGQSFEWTCGTCAVTACVRCIRLACGA